MWVVINALLSGIDLLIYTIINIYKQQYQKMPFVNKMDNLLKFVL